MRKNAWWGAAALLCAWPAAEALAFSYSAGSMTSWSSCDSGCKGQNSLSYTDDQISMFISEMNDIGHTKDHWYHNNNVWSSDLIEDNFGGEDWYYTDPHTLYIYSGHGGAYNDAAGKQKFTAPMCHTMSGDCSIRSEKTRLGERTGPYAGSPGNMRYLILCTCFSVHTAAGQQWGDQFRYGTDIVFGYRGVSADAEMTDEVPEDFAEASFDDSDKFKAGWFWAIEDWWVDDVGALVASGTSTANAKNRRDNMKRTWARRPNSETHSYRAWSWHEG